jgi:hypothetical protein
MARSRPFLSEALWKKFVPLLPKPLKQVWSSGGRQPSRAERDFVDSAERGSLAGSTGEISASLDMLAAAARLGGAGCLAEHAARILERVERAHATGLERTVFGRQFRSGQKRGAEVGKPSGPRGRSGWWWSTARVFLWETSFTLHLRRKSSSRKRARVDPRKPPTSGGSTAPEAGGRDLPTRLTTAIRCESGCSVAASS